MEEKDPLGILTADAQEPDPLGILSSSPPKPTPSVQPETGGFDFTAPFKPVAGLSTKNTIPIVEPRTDLIKTPYQVEQEKTEAGYKKELEASPLGALTVAGKRIAAPIKELYQQGKEAVKGLPAALMHGAALITPDNAMSIGPGGYVAVDPEMTKRIAEGRKQIIAKGVAELIKQREVSANKPLIRSIKEIENAGDAVHYAAGAIGTQIPQILASLGTVGLSSVLQETANNHVDQVQAIAEKEGISTQEVLAQKKDNQALAIGFGVVQGALDRVGAGKLAGIAKGSPLYKKLINSLWEAGTEIAQGRLNKVSTGLATDKSVVESLATNPGEMLDEAAQALLLGGASSAISGSGRPEAQPFQNNPTIQSNEQISSGVNQTGSANGGTAIPGSGRTAISGGGEETLSVGVPSLPSSVSGGGIAVPDNANESVSAGDVQQGAVTLSPMDNSQGTQQPAESFHLEGNQPTDVNLNFLKSLNEKELQSEHADAVSRGDQQWASTVEQVAQQKGVPLTTTTNEQITQALPAESADTARPLPITPAGENTAVEGTYQPEVTEGITEQPEITEEVTSPIPITNPPNETRTAEQSTTPQNDNAGITGLEGVAAQERAGREAEGSATGAIAGQQTIDLTEIGQAVKFEHGDGTTHNGTVVANYPDGSVQVKAHNGRIYTVKPDKLRETPYSAFQRTGLISITPNLGFVSDLIDLIPKAKRLVQQQLMSRGLLPQSVFNRLNQANAEAKSITKQIDYTSDDLRRAMKKDFGPNPTPAQITSVDEVLRGVQPATILSPRLVKVVIEMRSQVDALSNAMISSGSVQGKSVATIQQNLGTYLTRSYRVFDDKNYGPDKVDPQVMNNAVAFVRGQFPQATPDQIDGYIRGFLMEKGEQSPIQLIKQGKLGSKDISILKQRKDIPPEIRALMGEYADPLLNYARSVTRMASLVANQKFLTDVRTMGLNKFLFEGEIPPDNVHVKRIASEDSKTFNPLNGLWTTPDIAEAFQKMGSGPSAESAFMKIYNPVNYALKHGLTVFSPITHVRNFTSNFWVAIANGHFDVTKAVSAAKTIATDLGNLSKDAYREKYKKYASLGIVQDGSRSEELRAVLKDIIKDGDGAFPHLEDSRVKKILNSLKTGVQNAYAAEDEVWKIFGYENEYQRYRRALPHLSDAEVEQMAAQNIRDTYPTYSLTPELVRQFRKAPLVGTFVAFPSEIIRTSFNIAALTKKELATPGLRSIGLQRLSGMAMAASAPYIINALTQKWYGVDDEEDKELARFKAPWAKNAQDAYIARPKEGVYKYIDMSYSDPYAYLRKPLMALLQDDSLEERAIEATWEAASPFLSPEILALSIGEVVFNKQKNSGREVYNEQLPPGDKAKAAFLYVTGKTTPGFIKTGKELYKGVAGETNEYGKAYNAKETLAKVFTGQKIETLDVGENLGFKIRGFQRKLIEAKQIFTSVDRKTVPQSKKDEAKIKSEEAIAKLMESMQKDVKAAIKLGVPANVVYKMVEGARINQENTAKILGSSPSTTGAERSGVSRESQGTERKAVERQAIEP